LVGDGRCQSLGDDLDLTLPLSGGDRVTMKRRREAFGTEAADDGRICARGPDPGQREVAVKFRAHHLACDPGPHRRGSNPARTEHRRAPAALCGLHVPAAGPTQARCEDLSRSLTGTCSSQACRRSIHPDLGQAQFPYVGNEPPGESPSGPPSRWYQTPADQWWRAPRRGRGPPVDVGRCLQAGHEAPDGLPTGSSATRTGRLATAVDARRRRTPSGNRSRISCEVSPRHPEVQLAEPAIDLHRSPPDIGALEFAVAERPAEAGGPDRGKPGRRSPRRQSRCLPEPARGIARPPDNARVPVLGWCNKSATSRRAGQDEVGIAPPVSRACVARAAPSQPRRSSRRRGARTRRWSKRPADRSAGRWLPECAPSRRRRRPVSASGWPREPPSPARARSISGRVTDAPEDVGPGAGTRLCRSAWRRR